MSMIRSLAVASATLALVTSAQSQTAAPSPAKPAASARLAPEPSIDLPGPPIAVIDPETGVASDLPTFARWHYMCGSDLTNVSEQTLRDIIAKQEALFAPGQPIIVVDTPRTGVRAATFNVVFNLAGSVPASAVQSFTLAEQYLESIFTNPITITINVGFASLGTGVIGATGSNYINGVSYATSRTRLVAQAASGTDIQNFLPATSTMPVRFNGATTTITNVSTVNWTIGNAKAAGVTSSNSVVGNMTYNSGFAFDFDPSNGVPTSTLSLVDTIVHETGHAMGFVSEADNQTASQVDTMDLFRFQRTNSTGTWNPTSNATFTTYPRLVSYNSPNDDHIVDLISGEYRMSDGTPYQASHFRQQSPIIGIMEPALANGQTFYPNYMRTADVAVFKAMGWVNTPPCTTTITAQPNPSSYSTIAGQAVQFSVGVTSTGSSVSYQWLRNGQLVSAANTRFSGSTSATLAIDPLVTGDAGTYTCIISSPCGGATSDAVTLTVANRCPADRDNGTASGRPDGAVVIDDLLFYVGAFEAGTVDADLDNGQGLGITDGAVTIDDLIFFLVHFEAGC